jgi:3-deoxy-D-manno-octulosonate 8-phosphate phosphatase (KDO 8-P phosphatase)
MHHVDPMIQGLMSKVKLLALDVDGVLTDGLLLYGPNGEEYKSFHVRDGLGLRIWLDSGRHVAIISGRASKAVEARGAELGITEVHLNVKDKLSVLNGVMNRLNLDSSQVCAVGDDVPDLAMFEAVGVAAAPQDAMPEVKRAAHVVTQARGGHGAVRELIEMLLKAQG